MKLIRQPLQHMSRASVFSTSLLEGKMPLHLLGQASLTRRKYILPSTMRIMSRIVEVFLRTPIACEDSKAAVEHIAGDGRVASLAYIVAGSRSIGL